VHGNRTTYRPCSDDVILDKSASGNRGPGKIDYDGTSTSKTNLSLCVVSLEMAAEDCGRSSKDGHSPTARRIKLDDISISNGEALDDSGLSNADQVESPAVSFTVDDGRFGTVLGSDFQILILDV
jgi:hypothetical protein